MSGDNPGLTVIGKKANFRSVSTIVDCLNRMRPELPQFVVDPNLQGSVRVFHTNNWIGARKTGQHWGGDLPDEAADAALKIVIEALSGDGWKWLPEETRILMLTHRVLASKQGYTSLPTVFASKESFTKKAHAHVAFFADALEPACEAFLSRRYGEMFQQLGSGVPSINSQDDKAKWSASMARLIDLRNNGTVGEVVDHLRQTRRPRLPDSVEQRERELAEFGQGTGEGMPPALAELNALRRISYREIIALCRYLDGHSPFETKHGVKGAEFENVLVVVGRGWNLYNFNEMMELARDAHHVPANKQHTFERNRNLFYVTCSRPKKRLALLFTQKLSELALQTVGYWFGKEVIEALEF